MTTAREIVREHMRQNASARWALRFVREHAKTAEKHLRSGDYRSAAVSFKLAALYAESAEELRSSRASRG